MNRRFLLPLLFLLIGIISEGIQSQTLIIKFKDGSENAELLNSLQKLTFSIDDLLVHFNSGSFDTYGLSTIRKMYFNTPVVIEEDPATEYKHLEVFPNPGSSSITITGIPEDAGFISLYRMDGTSVQTEKVMDINTTLDVTDLRPGLYLLHALGHTAKFVKQ